MSKAFFIGGFKEAWAKKSMDFERGTNYFMGKRVMLHGS